MNKEHGKRVAEIIKSLDDARTELDEHLTAASGVIDDAKRDTTSLKDELQEKLDDMSDEVREGEKGEELSGEIDKLETIENRLDEAKESLDDYLPFDESIDVLKEIVGK